MGLQLDFVNPIFFKIHLFQKEIEIPYYGCCCLLGALTFLLLLEKELNKRKIDLDASIIVILAYVFSQLGSKLHFCLTEDLNIDSNKVFENSFKKCMMNLNQGHAFQGGFLLATFIVLLYAKGSLNSNNSNEKKVLCKLVDVLGPLIMFGYAFGKVGCFLCGDGCYGPKTNVFWGMSFPNGIRPTPENTFVHPTPLYESAFGFVFGRFLFERSRRMFFSLGAIEEGKTSQQQDELKEEKSKNKIVPHGSTGALTFIGFGLWRIFIDYWRNHARNISVFDFFEISIKISQFQLAGVFIFLVGVFFWWFVHLQLSPIIPEKQTTNASEKEIKEKLREKNLKAGA